jgi:hypothetical protein
MFAAQITKPVTIGDNTYTIRKLSWRSLENAQQKQLDNYVAMQARLGSLSAKLDEAAATAKPSDRKSEPELDKYAMFDKGTVLTAGVKAVNGEGKVNVDELTKGSSDVLFREIINLSLDEEESKNA